MNANKQDVGGLLPCPFCGGAAQLSDGECGIRGMPMNWRNPRCTRCGCDLGYCHHIEAVERWNRRAELCRAAPAGGVSCTFAHGDDWPCSICGTPPKDSAPAGSGEVEALVQKWRSERIPLVDNMREHGQKHNAHAKSYNAALTACADALTHPNDASAREADRESLLSYKEIVHRLASTRDGCIELAKVVHRELDFIDRCITDAIARCEAAAALPSPPKEKES